jgi:hypothetical protein
MYFPPRGGDLRVRLLFWTKRLLNALQGTHELRVHRRTKGVEGVIDVFHDSVAPVPPLSLNPYHAKVEVIVDREY